MLHKVTCAASVVVVSKHPFHRLLVPGTVVVSKQGSPFHRLLVPGTDETAFRRHAINHPDIDEGLSAWYHGDQRYVGSSE
jgi:hypothetical protein